MLRVRFVIALVAVMLLCLPGASARADDEVRGWLQWRGPDQNGTSQEKGLPESWKLDGENHRWHVDLKGRGTPLIASGRVFTWGYRGERDELVEVLACLDEATGKTLWEREFRDFMSDVIYDRYSIGSPVIDAETARLYLMTSTGQFTCFTLDGELVWEHSMMEEFGRNTYPNGRTGAPTIEGDLVIVRGVSNNWGRQGPPRDRFYAFDKRTGEPVWASTAGKGPPFLKDSCFATPVYDWWEGRRVFYTGLGSGSIVCINAWTGKPLWRSQQIVGGINSSVLRHGGNLLAIHGRQNLDTTETGRMLALKLPTAERVAASGKDLLELGKADEAWRNDLSMFTSSPVLVGDRIYQVTQTGDLYCVDATSGKKLWHEKLGPSQIHASPLYADGKLYVPMNNGSFFIIRPGEQGAEVLAKVQLRGNCLGSPAAWNGKVYVHTTERLYCFGIDGDTDAANLPAAPAAVKYGKPGDAVALQIVPNEVLLRPGDTATFRAWTIDARGQRVREVTEKLAWAKFIPPTAKVKAKLDADFDGEGKLVAGEDAQASAGAFKATLGELSATIRGRVVVNLPYEENFEGYDLKVDHATEGVKFAFPPLPWLGARFRWEVREAHGSRVLAKTTDNLILHRAVTFVGHPAESSYTIEADVLSDGNRRGMGEMGVINQRYIIKLKGNHDQIEVSSNIERLAVRKPFTLKPKTWYRIKSRVDVGEDGTGVIRAKAWERGAPEPAAWTIEVTHRNAHTQGPPGLFGLSPHPQFRVYVDNLKITPSGPLAAVTDGDWPQWGRDGSKNMAARATGIPMRFEPGEVGRDGEVDLGETENVKWVAKLGSQTYGNPTVVGGRVYVGTNNQGRGDARFKGDYSVVHCLDEKTGDIIWSLTVPKLGSGKVGDWEFLGICSSPTVIGDRVYVMTNRCEVIALDVNGLADGNQGLTDEGQYMSMRGTTPLPPVEVKPTDADIIWRYDMRDELGIYPHNITSSSILAVGDVLYCSTSNGVTYDHTETPSPKAPALIALDRKRAEDPSATPADILIGEEGSGLSKRILHGNWTSPCWGNAGGRDILIYGGPGGFLYGFDPKPVKDADGFGVLPELWRVDLNPLHYRFKDGDRSKPIKYATPNGPSEIISTPIFHEGRVYVGIGQDPEHGEGIGNFACVDAETGKLLWDYPIKRTLSTASAVDGFVYVADHSGFLHCFDANDGTLHWRYDTGSLIWGSTLVTDGKVFIGNEDGDLTVVAIGPMKALAEQHGGGIDLSQRRKKLTIERDGKKVATLQGKDVTKLVEVIVFGKPVYLSPVVVDDTLYVGTMTHLYAVKKKD